MHQETRERFSRLARGFTQAVGSLIPAMLSVVFVVAWLVVGVVIDFPDWWMSALTETSAAVTLLMVFVIQHTNNREAHATALKLDELIRASENATEKVAGIENRELSEQEQLGESRA
ncbi:MAG: low affinity iron permease family protein [Streptosporangiaceae bacterium]